MTAPSLAGLHVADRAVEDLVLAGAQAAQRRSHGDLRQDADLRDLAAIGVAHFLIVTRDPAVRAVKRIDLDFAKETLGAAITRPREIITVDGVIKAVASYYGLKPSDIKSERRHKSVATPRAVAMYISRHHTKDSYPDLARAFGGKHHTTVISAVQKIIERVKDDASLRSEIHAIESMILR
jgi:chromosomal replication initiation ATPase DnaA